MGVADQDQHADDHQAVLGRRTDRLNVTPLQDPASAVVARGGRNVDTVLVAGRVLKRAGRLEHVDWPAVMRASSESRDHVLAKSGFKPPRI
ncbi:MAG: hypothetical protein WD378_03345 [Egicoccus sp.]